jgi:hypothetical protein
MSKRPFAESLLALTAGRTRAAAIYGDLLELAATRGRTSFWRGYCSTLISLSWRPLAAFSAGTAVFVVLYESLFMGLWFFAMDHPHMGESFGDATFQLWFLVPFAAVRYGIRDRPVQVAFTALLVATGCLTLLFSVPEIWILLVWLAAFGIATATPWRRSLIPLAVSCTVGAGITEIFFHVGHLDWAIPGLPQSFPVLPSLIDMLAVSILFSWTHRRFHRSQNIGAAHA